MTTVEMMRLVGEDVREVLPAAGLIHSLRPPALAHLMRVCFRRHLLPIVLARTCKLLD